MGRHRTRVTETVQGPPSSRSVLVAGAQGLLEATAARIRNEVAGLDGDLLDEKLLLLQQLDHLDAALSLLERLLPAGSEADVKLLSPEELCEACRHLNMAIHTMLALAPKFRQATSHRLVKQLGSSLSSRLDCCSRRRTAVELSPEKRKSRMRVHLDKLEKEHESCLLDLLLTFEYLATAEALPPPDAPPRCAEGSRYVLAGQAKLHQSHAMLCQLLIEEDDLLLPILEWQLGAAASDFAVARALLDCLPRAAARRRRTKIESHSPPPATVGVRCESKARILTCAPPGEPSVRFAETSEHSSPTETRPHLPRSPVAAARKGKHQHSCNGYAPQEASPPIDSSPKAGDGSALQMDGSCGFGHGLSNMRSSSSLPNLGALGPCSLCTSAAPVRQPHDAVSERYGCVACDCPARTGAGSPFDSRVADCASWGSMVGSDYRQR